MKDGGPAFPVGFGPDGSPSGESAGMTLRDYAEVAFTAAWIQALALRYNEPGWTDSGAAQEAGQLGREQADAMLAARAPQEG